MNFFTSDQITTNAGCYQLFLKVMTEQILCVGKLGWLTFIPGTYVYCGRHQNALGKRINRHLKREKKIRWHIDYLTANNRVKLYRVIIFPDRVDEFTINQNFLRLNETQILHPGFGSSDCRLLCPAHLCYLKHFDEDQFLKWKSNFFDCYFFEIG